CARGGELQARRERTRPDDADQHRTTSVEEVFGAALFANDDRPRREVLGAGDLMRGAVGPPHPATARVFALAHATPSLALTPPGAQQRQARGHAEERAEDPRPPNPLHVPGNLPAGAQRAIELMPVAGARVGVDARAGGGAARAKPPHARLEAGSNPDAPPA